MKRVGKFLILALLLVPFYTYADEFLDDDLHYGFEDGSTTQVYVNGLRNSSATHITIPATVVYEYAEYDDRDDEWKIKRRTCTVTSIRNYAFSGYSSLAHVTIQNGVASIGGWAFHGCSSLESVTIPSSVTSIGYDVFNNCTSLTSVTMPDSVTSIGARAFQNCTSLTSVTMPDSVTSIGAGAFRNCTSLTSVMIPSSVTSIGSSAFQDCSSLTSVTIPSSVTSIGSFAFQNCSSLASVILPPYLTSIGSGAFYNCSSLENVIIPDSVTDIEGNAFYGCSRLTFGWFGSGVTNIHYSAFNLCENLQRFVVEDDNPAYASVDGALCSKDLKTLVIYPRGRVDVRLPDGLSAAMPDAFAGCNKLWMEWCKRINTIPYDLTQAPADRAIADVTVIGDTALDEFVLKEGKVYDSVLYICNNAGYPVRVTLPSMPLTSYKTFKGASPLTLPAYSTSILTITRVAGGNAGGNVFLVTREELEEVK